MIVGAGFGGLACAQALGSSAAKVTLVDRNNYHLFVPLLYQVATAALSPADIAEPIRKIVRKHPTIDVRLGDVTGVDYLSRAVLLKDGETLEYDILILATGSRYNYFSHPEWEAHAEGVKTIANARMLRSRLLRSFKLAEREPDPVRQRALMTTVVVGGGPTGVEMAGAIAELARYTLARDFRRIDPASARIILVEAGERILSSFPEKLGRYGKERLKKLGVEVLCRRVVDAIGPESVTINGEELPTGTTIWAAGLRASDAGLWLGVPVDRMGRVEVRADLSVVDREAVYMVGDSALFVDAATKRPLPALAQVAKQQGRHLGRALARQLGDGSPVPPFQFRDRGNTAIVGRSAAMFDFGKWQMKGRPAWILWAIVHVYLLVGFSKRVQVSLQWLWRYISYERGARLIVYEEEYDRAPSPPAAGTMHKARGAQEVTVPIGSE